MRRLQVFTLCVTLLLAACGENDADRQSAERAIDVASTAIQAQLITSTLADIAATTPVASGPEERAQLLASGIEKIMDCGSVSALGSAVLITFDGLGCVLRDKRLWGEVLIEVSEMPERATLNLSTVSDGGITLSGESTLTLSEMGRTIVDHATLTPHEPGASSYTFRDQRTESVVTSGLTIHSGSRCTVLTSSAAACELSAEGAMCITLEGDCHETYTQELELAWTQDVAQVGNMGAHRIILPGFTREVELAYGTGEALQANLDATLAQHLDADPSEAFDSDDYFHGRCPQDDGDIVAEPGFVCIASLIWTLEANTATSESPESSTFQRASEVKNYFKFWVNAH